MRHFDVGEISKFILYVNENKFINNYYIETYFENIRDINIINIKLYYLTLLKKCKKHYEDIYKHFKNINKKFYESSIKITTNDSHTLTDGPTIFLTTCDEFEKNIFTCIANSFTRNGSFDDYNATE